MQTNEAVDSIRIAGLQAVDLADAAAFVPLRADLFGICDGSRRASRRSARKSAGDLEAAALSSICESGSGLSAAGEQENLAACG
jgi:hypothetical protein